MKSIVILSVFIILSFLAPAQPTWYWNNPYPDGYNLNDVWFTSAGHGWAVGDGGKLLQYDGERWTGYERLTFRNLNGLWFTDENHGWAVGNNGVILNFTDGLWTQVYTGTTQHLRDVCFTGENNGWAVGDVRMHYDGSQWTTLDTIGYGGLTEVFFTDANNGWCGGFDKFYKYDTTGWHWYPLVSSDVISVNSLYFTDPMHGWLGGYYSDGIYYIKEYNGSTWNWSNTHPPLQSNALYFDNPTHGWSCGGQAIFNLTDTTVYEFTGNQWRGSYVSPGVPTSLAAVNANELYMVTRFGHILHHDDAGWGYSNTLAEGSMELSFPDSTHGWAVGNGKNILRYTPGTWKADTTFDGMNLEHIHFADSLHGIASGWSEASRKTGIYHYSGSGWQLITDTISSHIHAVAALPNGESWFSGESTSGAAKMYHLTGNTIAVTTIPGIWTITSLSFSDFAHGWAIGTKTGSLISKIIRYQAGTWVEDFSAPSGQTLTAVSFSTQNSGWAVGQTWDNVGISYHFDGLVWSSGPGAAGGLLAVHQPDPAHVYAVSYSAVYTLDNNVWVPEPLNTGQSLVSVCFPNPGTGWVGGANGGILSTRSSFPVAIPDKTASDVTDRLLVFPNPATGEFLVNIPGELLNEKQFTLQLYDAQGNLVEKLPVIGVEGKVKLNIKTQPKGLYHIILNNGVTRYSGKLIKN